MKKLFLKLITALFLLTPILAHADDNKALRKAAYAGDLTRIEQLLAQGADANNHGNKGGTPLIKAAKKGHMAVSQLLMFHGADPNKKNKKGRSAIDIAEKNEYHELAEVMRYGTREQSVAIDTGKALSADKFRDIVSRAMQGRKWQIESAAEEIVVGRYDRKGIAYKIEAKMGGSLIQLKFLRGYGAKKTGYLENLKKDISTAL